MINQRKNLLLVEHWKRIDDFPRFILIQGENGSGRSELAKIIADNMKSNLVIINDFTVDNIRNVITMSQTCKDKTCFLFKSVDTLSNKIQNALLKSLEEPPRNVYFILTVANTKRVLATIISRAYVMSMNRYTLDNLKSFTDDDVLLRYCNTPGQCLTYKDNEDFKDLVRISKSIINQLLSGKGTDILRVCRELDKELDYDMFWNILQKDILATQNLNLIKSFTSNLGSVEREFLDSSMNRKFTIETFLLNVYKDTK